MPAIVTVTSAYYTTGSDPGAAWTNEALAWDSTITGSTGALMMCATKGVSNTAKNLLFSGNNLSTVAGDPITKVEIGYRGKIYNANQVVYLQPIFGGSSVGDAIMIDPVTTNWQTLYTDITTVAGAPATWTRQAIADLDVNLYGYSSAKTASASTLVIDAVLIKVTETSGIVNALAYYTTASTTIDKITDDEFDNSSIGVQWTQSTNTGASITETTELKIVSALSSAYEIYLSGMMSPDYYPKTGLYSTSVTGDFLIEMKVRNYDVSTMISGVGLAPYVTMFISSALGTTTAITYRGLYLTSSVGVS